MPLNLYISTLPSIESSFSNLTETRLLLAHKLKHYKSKIFYVGVKIKLVVFSKILFFSIYIFLCCEKL